MWDVERAVYSPSYDITLYELYMTSRSEELQHSSIYRQGATSHYFDWPG